MTEAADGYRNPEVSEEDMEGAIQRSRAADAHNQRAAEWAALHPPDPHPRMTTLSKILLAVCAILIIAVIYLGRERVSAAGPRGMWVLVYSPWTGAAKLCPPVQGECRPVYPPIRSDQND